MMKMMQGRAWVVWAALATVVGCGRPRPIPEALRIKTAGEMIAKMNAHSVSIGSYSAELRITSFGKQGRVRGTASLAVTRPASLRYELLGPHGAPIMAFATNGKELQQLDLTESVFLYGPATAENLSQLMGWVPIDFRPADWVALLFGELQVPEDAKLSFDETTALYRLEWLRGGRHRSVMVDPASYRPVRADLIEGGALAWTIEVTGRGQSGLVSELVLEAPSMGLKTEVMLRDVELEPQLEPSLFQLDPPPGVRLERLGG